MNFFYKRLKIYYEKEGTGGEVPLLFLHGWGGSTLSFKFFYDFFVSSRMCINIDLPPFGKSSQLLKPFEINDYFEIVKKILKKEKIKKINIVAHSFGGRIAVMLASKTDFVEKMVLTGSAGLKTKSLKKFLKIKTYKFFKWLSKLHLIPYSKLNNFGSQDYKKLNPIMKKTFSNIVNYDEKKLLKSITSPTLLIWGDKDKETPFYFTKIFKKHIKDCEIIKFEGGSHFAYLEKPKYFLNIILNFFN